MPKSSSPPDNSGDPDSRPETGESADVRATGDPKGFRGSGNRRELLRYAGLSSEVFVSVGLSIFIGIKADKWVALSFPIFSWALPLLVIVVLIIKLVKETSRKKDGK
jgi:hypothetical protein